MKTKETKEKAWTEKKKEEKKKGKGEWDKYMYVYKTIIMAVVTTKDEKEEYKKNA